MYEPPETARILKRRQSLDGLYFDLWAFGAMSLELLADFHISRSFSSRPLNTKARNDSMRDVLQGENFRQKMKSALPAVELAEEDAKMALNFLHSFLRSDPTERITAEIGMTHQFLGKGDFLSSEVDVLWQQPDAAIDQQTMVDGSCGKRLRRWFRRRCSSIRKFFKRCKTCCCLPCGKEEN